MRAGRSTSATSALPLAGFRRLISPSCTNRAPCAAMAEDRSGLLLAHGLPSRASPGHIPPWFCQPLSDARLLCNSDARLRAYNCIAQAAQLCRVRLLVVLLVQY